MIEEITLVDRGRGLQLATSRITVMDLVPYFKQGLSYDEIIHWLPTLSVDEIAAVENYYREHKAELDEKDRLAREYREEQIHLQHQRLPETDGTSEERMTRLKRLLRDRGHQEKNGDAAAG